MASNRYLCSNTAPLYLGSNQHPLRYSRSREVEAKICVLDPRSPSRGQGDSEGQMGWRSGEERARTLDTPAEANRVEVIWFEDRNGDASLRDGDILEDLRANQSSDIRYILGSATGDEGNTPSQMQATSRCFNCGSPDHLLSNCPTPRNRALVALSRQLYEFYRSSSQQQFDQRIHEFEGWKSQRLTFLDEFTPGAVKGADLMDALDGQEEWLKNMCIWGYPRGWFGKRDPKDVVMERILGVDDSEADEEENFFINDEEDGAVEELDLAQARSGMADSLTRPRETENKETYIETLTSRSESTCESESTSSFDEPRKDVGEVTRWAKYPATYFSSDLLPIYNGFSLPSMDDSPSQHPALSLRSHTGFDIFLDSAPPPSTTPPPLPPPPEDPTPLPPMPGSDPSLLPFQKPLEENLHEDSDMEMSDED